MSTTVGEVISGPSARTARIRLTAAYFAAFIALGLTTGSLGPTLPALSEQTSASVSSIGYVFTLRSVGYVFGSLRGGKLFDYFSGNTLMGLLLLTISATVALVPFAGGLGFLLAVMFILGTFEACLDVGANTLLVRVHSERVAPYMSAMHSCFGVGALIAPIIVAQIALAGQAVTRSYFILSILLLPISAFTIRLPDVRKPATVKLDGPTHSNSSLILFLSVFLFFYVGAEIAFAGWIFTYAVMTRLGSAAAAAYLTSLFWGALTAGRALLIPVVARVKPEVILVTSLLCALLTLGIMLLGGNSLILVSTATLGFGLSMASIFPATLSFAGQRLPVTGSVTGWFIVGSSLGATTVPLLVGKLQALTGPSTMIWSPLLALATATSLFVIMVKQPKQPETILVP